ncbi:MAG TPA: formylglycine-generating enzyme family protein [Terriglobia bacterium]|nr:formylglycine-generating enzyme family protein [Terriglobia bacterium]
MQRHKALSPILILLSAMSLRAQDTGSEPQGEQIPGPAKATATEDHCCARNGQIPVPVSTWKAWLADIQHYRSERLIRAGYRSTEYDRRELKWTQTAFIEPQMMIEDRYFYDPGPGRYTVDRYLDDLQKRYGGVDAVLLWHTYTNIGVDSRNQYDLLRDMPGGVAGVRQMIADFHRRGVRVLLPVMLWDQGTRDEGASNAARTAQLLADIGADGVNGDTLAELPLAFREASDATGHPLAFEPEGTPENPGEALAWNNLSWAYWKFPFEPMVGLYKWLEPRHLVHVCDRWARDKTDNLQYAFFNGVGYESWENIWGIWNQIDDRDAEALRRIAKIERGFANALTTPGWEPHFPMLQYGAFSSRFPTGGETLWTIVNRNEFSLAGAEIQVPYRQGERYYDVWHGTELRPRLEGETAILSFDIEAHGYGAILATSQLSGTESRLIGEMQDLAQSQLSSYSHQWHFLPQHLVEIPFAKPIANPQDGMVKIPEGDFLFRVSGVEIEGGNDVGVDVQFPWEDSPRRQHLHPMHLSSFYIDRYPVTNADFKKFVDATHYEAKDDHNFLRDWKSGTYPDGWANKPVTWVSLEDARSYAAWAGKRLPHEWEWQYAAEGPDGRTYPWGNDWDRSRVPAPDTARNIRPPTDVGGYPAGVSPFGVMDLVGNVWQWTDEFQDEHTRAAILRGGSYYQPQGSRWYFPQAYRLDEHGKYLLMAPGIDRAATIGFRCVRDAQN